MAKETPTAQQKMTKAPTTEQPRHILPDNFILSKQGLNEILKLVEVILPSPYLKKGLYDCINDNLRPYSPPIEGKKGLE